MPDETQAGAGESTKTTSTPGSADPTNTGSEGGDTKSTQPSATGKEEEAKAFDPTLLDKVVESTAPRTPEQNLSPEAQKQVDKWKNRVIEEQEDGDGQPYSLAHPKIPSWVKRILKTDPLIGETTERPGDHLKQAQAELRYNQLILQIPKLTPAKQMEIAKDVAHDVKYGMPKDIALERALRLNQVQTQAYQEGMNKALRAAPPEGEPVAYRPQGRRYSEGAIKRGQELFGLSAKDWEKYGNNI